MGEEGEGGRGGEAVEDWRSSTLSNVENFLVFDVALGGASSFGAPWLEFPNMIVGFLTGGTRPELPDSPSGTSIPEVFPSAFSRRMVGSPHEVWEAVPSGLGGSRVAKRGVPD